MTDEPERPEFVWTPEIIALASAMWLDHKSSGAIALVIGTTRNAVIGKINRLGLTRKRIGPRPKKEARIVEKGAAPMLKVTPRRGAAVYDAPMPPTPSEEPRLAALFIEPTPASEPGQLTLLDLRAGQCKWPLGAPMDRPGFFCGEPQRIGKPYCAEHCKVAYVPAGQSRRAA